MKENIKNYLLDIFEYAQNITDYSHNSNSISIENFKFKFNQKECSINVYDYKVTHFNEGSFSLFFNGFNFTFSITIIEEYLQDIFSIQICWRFKNYKLECKENFNFPPNYKKIEYYLKTFLNSILSNNFEYDITDNILRNMQSIFRFIDSDILP